MRDGDRLVATLGPGAVVGEIAALDWGAGYGTLRRNRVTTTRPTSVLALPRASSEAVLRRLPDVAERLCGIAERRLQALNS